MNRTFAKDHERKKLPSISSIIITIIIIFSVAFRFSHLSFLSIWIQFNVFGCMIYSPACVCVCLYFFIFHIFPMKRLYFIQWPTKNGTLLIELVNVHHRSDTKRLPLTGQWADVQADECAVCLCVINTLQ